MFVVEEELEGLRLLIQCHWQCNSATGSVPVATACEMTAPGPLPRPHWLAGSTTEFFRRDDDDVRLS